MSPEQEVLEDGASAEVENIRQSERYQTMKVRWCLDGVVCGLPSPIVVWNLGSGRGELACGTGCGIQLLEKLLSHFEGKKHTSF